MSLIVLEKTWRGSLVCNTHPRDDDDDDDPWITCVLEEHFSDP